ncbi:3-oxoadipyl-CoA thiolase [Jiulongibacter sediminis]|uniref:Beta-ketoadipyl-CoA thiolase n=1 Tax=Jiulongibacter sediminis TaxID=1605367 RepID=A0A0P7C2N0_9BACT|nr:3-oxoadipyl-CoA thiolase [Jiulongibacter sediminis]KPM48909.1 beta-ketoadipyl CoA thiolase [Jiulongibacter sediminis]TBX25438.1 beta-ketoadipyl CoA thiolase [Jiulongibacter sediminis]
MKEAYIIDAIRTPIGSFRGRLSPVRADDLAAIPIKELIRRNPNIPVEEIEDVILGCHNQAGEDNRNVARMALLLAGLPHTIPGETVNRLCSSGMSAVVQANRAIKAGDGDLFISGGMEHMTRGPLVISKASASFGNDAKMEDSSFGWRFVNPKLHKMYGTDAMGVTAENLAELYNISRDDQDLFAYNSQQKAFKAQQNGILAEEIVPVEMTDRKGNVTVFDQDEFIKGNSTLEKLATLKTVFKKEGGTVTAGNASGLNDGAAAMLIASEEAIKNHSLKPMARIISSGVVGVEPRIMGIGPVGATQKALKKAGLSLDQMDVIEFNEAFAAQCLAVSRNLGLADDDLRINPNGGAIAIGHPLGMSGTRIVQAAANQLRRTGGRYGLAAMCVGVGMGYAVVIENVS